MEQKPESTIGLADLVQKVKQDLLSDPDGKGKNAPFLFVDSVELELKVTIKYDGTAGIKINVLSLGSGEAKGGLSREDVHTVKVKLSPLFDKAQLLEWYKDIYGNDILAAVKASMDGLIKGDEENLADRY